MTGGGSTWWAAVLRGFTHSRGTGRGGQIHSPTDKRRPGPSRARARNSTGRWGFTAGCRDHLPTAVAQMPQTIKNFLARVMSRTRGRVRALWKVLRNRHRSAPRKGPASLQARPAYPLHTLLTSDTDAPAERSAGSVAGRAEYGPPGGQQRGRGAPQGIRADRKVNGSAGTSPAGDDTDQPSGGRRGSRAARNFGAIPR